jgi:hypothetical protein
VEAFNARAPADAYFHQAWRQLLPDAAYARSLPDGQKGQAKGGALPRTMGEGAAKPGPAYYAALLSTPFADDLTLQFARAAIAGEALGRDDSPDLLIVSLSSHDLVNHAHGAESRLSHDHLLQLDRLLQDFLNDVDVAVGRDNYVAVLTADHGFMPAPEHSLALGRDAGRVNTAQVLARLQAGLAKRFGEGTWTLGFSAQGFLLNGALMAERKVARSEVTAEARRILAAEAGIAAVYTRAEMEGNTRAGAPSFDALRKSWHKERSPDLLVALKPYWMFGGAPATHGSPYAYDTQVPLMLYGPPWIRAGRIDARVEMNSLAATLAAILHIPPPAAAEGKPLPLEDAGL